MRALKNQSYRLLGALKKLIFQEQTGTLVFEDTWEHELYWVSHDLNLSTSNKEY